MMTPASAAASAAAASAARLPALRMAACLILLLASGAFRGASAHQCVFVMTDADLTDPSVVSANMNSGETGCTMQYYAQDRDTFQVYGIGRLDDVSADDLAQFQACEASIFVVHSAVLIKADKRKFFAKFPTKRMDKLYTTACSCYKNKFLPFKRGQIKFCQDFLHEPILTANGLFAMCTERREGSPAATRFNVQQRLPALTVRSVGPSSSGQLVEVEAAGGEESWLAARDLLQQAGATCVQGGGTVNAFPSSTEVQRQLQPPQVSPPPTDGTSVSNGPQRTTSPLGTLINGFRRNNNRQQ